MNVDPMLCRSLEILYCIPWTSDTTAITDATPIITPNTVRTDRILLAKIARRAIFRFSTNMTKCRVPGAECRVACRRGTTASLESHGQLRWFSRAMNARRHHRHNRHQMPHSFATALRRMKPLRPLGSIGTPGCDFVRTLPRSSTSQKVQLRESDCALRNREKTDVMLTSGIQNSPVDAPFCHAMRSSNRLIVLLIYRLSLGT